MQQRTLLHVFSVLLCCATVAPAAAELTPQQITVVVNRSRPSGELSMHFSLPCCQLFATMALAME
jgi:hypothetical protein